MYTLYELVLYVSKSLGQQSSSSVSYFSGRERESSTQG